MELLLTITLSDRLFALLEDKLPNLGRRVEKAITKELGAQTRRESSISVEVNAGAQPTATESDKSKHSRRTKEYAPVEDTQAVEQQQPGVPEMQVEVRDAQSEKELTEEDIRAAIHRTRQRFEGEDYKDNTASEAYQKYHKPLTGMFLQIAAVLGADKPSALPADKRAAFIAECDALILDEKGFITPPPAPF